MVVQLKLTARGANPKAYGVTIRMNADFPINTLSTMRICHDTDARRKAFNRTLYTMFRILFDATLDKPRNLNLTVEIGTMLIKAGFDPKMASAVARGVFGASTFFGGNDIFWKHGRLEFVAEMISKLRAARSLTMHWGANRRTQNSGRRNPSILSTTGDST